MDPVLISLAIKEAPMLIATLRAMFAKAKPEATPPTDKEVIDAYNHAFASSIAKDEAWLNAHPE